MHDTSWFTPRPLGADGHIRKLGVELEFTGLSLPEVTAIAANWAGSEPTIRNIAQGSTATRWGELVTEIDWLHLKTWSEEQHGKPHNPAWLTLLRDVATVVVPTEIVLPPVPLDELDELESLITRLRAAGAKGTRHSPLAAYGVHLNPELPDLRAITICGYLQAFSLLQWWLVERCAVDITRKLSPYVDLYPEAYVLKTLSYTEKTSLHSVRLDYLEHNATRNRALDMWPLFCHLDQQWVESNMDNPLIKARPTLHYRLANCEVDDPEWLLASTWEPWGVVEALAAVPSLLNELAGHFRSKQRPLLGANRQQWVQWVDKWLKDRSLV